MANTPDFSAIGYFYALELYKTLKIPVGIICISWGGSNVQAWMSMENLSMFPEFDASKIDMNSKTPMRIPTALYNGMFNPVSKFGVKGVIWYQGESNLREEALYKKIFPAMVKEWRENIEMGTIPFYYAQIAPYRYDGSNLITSALIREAQLECLDIIPNSGMAVTLDVGDENLIHPAEKAIISKRLSYIALAKTYGFKYLHHKGPVFKTVKVNEEKMLLTFENTGNGFMPSVDGIKGFEVAGEDKVFYPALTKLKNGTEIEVWAKEVPNPLNVRYCFKNYTVGTLRDAYGLPASSFRTDK
jgi:sialate O-acetylesterase